MQQTSAWRYFPHAIIGALLFVAAVNGYMVYDALTTFPGQAGEDGFDLSNGYNKIMAEARQQQALGWKIEADATSEKQPEVRLADKTGAPLLGATIEATAVRPVGPQEKTTLAFASSGHGLYTTDTTLWSGQWDIMMLVRADGQEYKITRRIVVK